MHCWNRKGSFPCILFLHGNKYLHMWEYKRWKYVYTQQLATKKKFVFFQCQPSPIEIVDFCAFTVIKMLKGELEHTYINVLFLHFLVVCSKTATTGRHTTAETPVSLTLAANLPPMSLIPVARSPFHQNICHQCQRHRWQIMAAISDSLHLTVNMKKICVYTLLYICEHNYLNLSQHI